jgi:hypothetical protein
MEFEEGFELAAIYLKDICVDKTYWDILYFLIDLKDEILSTLARTDEVLEKIEIFNIWKSEDLCMMYKCHCHFENILNCQLHYKNTKNIGKSKMMANS